MTSINTYPFAACKPVLPCLVLHCGLDACGLFNLPLLVEQLIRVQAQWRAKTLLAMASDGVN